MSKILMIVLDGIGDRTYEELQFLTPLEYAKTPFFDQFVSQSTCGMLYALGPGIRPSSDVAHMELFGIDHKINYCGRGPIECLGTDMRLKSSDIAFRGNFSILDSNGLILDRRANRITPSRGCLEALEKVTIDGILIEMIHIAEHRFALKLSGENIDFHVCDSDPHIENVCPLKFEATKDISGAIHTAYVLNKYVQRVSRILCDYGEKSNYILLRGAGQKPNWYNFEEKYKLKAACIANNALYNGIGKILGMDIINPKHYVNYQNYYSFLEDFVLQTFKTHDFIFLHIQEGDLYGEDGEVKKKVLAIEQMDSALAFINHLPKDWVISITADHSTPCCLKAHSGDPVPLVIRYSNCRKDEVSKMGERYCSKGDLGIVLGKDYIQLLMNAAGLAPLIGG